jgi:hypothetical protein
MHTAVLASLVPDNMKLYLYWQNDWQALVRELALPRHYLSRDPPVFCDWIIANRAC